MHHCGLRLHVILSGVLATCVAGCASKPGRASLTERTASADALTVLLRELRTAAGVNEASYRPWLFDFGRIDDEAALATVSVESLFERLRSYGHGAWVAFAQQASHPGRARVPVKPYAEVAELEEVPAAVQVALLLALTRLAMVDADAPVATLRGALQLPVPVARLNALEEAVDVLVAERAEAVLSHGIQPSSERFVRDFLPGAEASAPGETAPAVVLTLRLRMLGPNREQLAQHHLSTMKSVAWPRFEPTELGDYLLHELPLAYLFASDDVPGRQRLHAACSELQGAWRRIDDSPKSGWGVQDWLRILEADLFLRHRHGWLGSDAWRVYGQTFGPSSALDVETKCAALHSSLARSVVRGPVEMLDPLGHEVYLAPITTESDDARFADWLNRLFTGLRTESGSWRASP